MILRFDILEPQNTGAPDYTLCGQAASVIPGAAIALSLKVNGQQVPFSVGSDPFRTQPVIEFGLGLNELSGATQVLGDGTEVTASYELSGGEHVQIQIDTPNNYPLGGELISEGNVIELTVEAPEDLGNGIVSHFIYSNAIEIFGFDIGNHGGVTGNPDCSVYLIPNIAGVVVNNVLRSAYAGFMCWRKPLTDAIYFFDAVSFGGDELSRRIYKDKDGNTISTTRNGFYCSPDCLEIQQIHTVIDPFDCVTDIDTCASDFKKHDPQPFFPTINLQASCPDCGQEDCFIVGVNGEARFFVDYHAVTQYNVNDDKRYPYDSQFFEYQVLEYTGAEVAQYDSSFTINPPDYVHNAFSTQFVGWSLPEIGDYMVKLTLRVPDVWECYETVKIKGCSIFEVEQTACNGYKIYNRSFDEQEVKILEMQDDKSFVEIDSVTIDSLSSVNITLTRDGIYQFVMKSPFGFPLNLLDYIVTVANFCNIRECLHKHITNLMCASPKNDCKEGDYYDFNALIVTLTTYFNQVNGEFISAPILTTVLADEKINELFTLKQYLDKMEEYCPDCDTVCNKCSNNKKSSLCKCQ